MVMTPNRVYRRDKQPQRGRDSRSLGGAADGDVGSGSRLGISHSIEIIYAFPIGERSKRRLSKWRCNSFR